MESNQTNKKDNWKVKVIILVALMLLIGLVSLLTSATSAEEPRVLKVDEVEKVVEEEATEEEVVEEESENTSNTTSKKTGSEFAEPADVANKEAAISHNEISAVEEHIDLTMTIGRNNPIVNSYSNSAFGGVTVKANGADVTKSCTVSYDSSKVGTVTGTYTVVITASCGTYGTVARQAQVTLHVPTADEKQTAKDNTDTSSSSRSPETPVVKDKNGNDTRSTSTVQEMTKITIIYSDGSQKTFVKTEVEDLYATQVEKIFHESEIPANYKINGNTLTVAGRTFVA